MRRLRGCILGAAGNASALKHPFYYQLRLIRSQLSPRRDSRLFHNIIIVMSNGRRQWENQIRHEQESPCDAIASKEVQRPPPDPFAQDEVREILAHLARHRPQQILDFVELMFYGGLRTSEGIGLRWEDIDFRAKEMRIEGGNVYDEETDTTKTSKCRIVLLSAPAFVALQRQKTHTFLQGVHVFHDPKTDEPWKYQTITDVRSFWKITLKRLGIRYRRPYNMRHTYATLGIMSGARPAFLATQLGHSLRVFFDVYAKWINSKYDREEIAKVDQAIAQLSPNCPQLS
jgi:integrase